MEDNEIINKCNSFLKKSDERYRATTHRALDDLSIYSGDFWNDDMKKLYRKGKNRVNLALNNWSTMKNAIASPVSNSPYHIELDDKSDEDRTILQSSIDLVESDNDNKTAMVDAAEKAILTGYGYLIASTVLDEVTNEPKIVVESARFINSVAMDPNINTIDGSDAEEGAIVNYISVKKAKRLYGEDVVPFSYPESQPALNISSFEQWNVPSDSVAIVSYYTKNDEGTVDYYKICGNKVVEHEIFPIKYIPIIRIAGNEIYESNQINYNGIIQQTLPLELGANIAYSTLIERCGRSTKANFIANVDAIDGLEKYYAKADQDESMLVLYKGDKQPVPLTEQFQTGDLQATISSCRTLMEDVIGIPLTGIAQNQPEKTATEVLRQQMSRESNVASYYNHIYTAMRTLGKIIIEMLNDGIDLVFTLENGPSVITRQMKKRQELMALGGIVPENMKSVIAKYYADTLKDDIGNDLSRNLVANMPVDVNFVTSESTDPTAIHQMNQMKATLDSTMEQLEQSQAEIAQLKQQLQNAQINLLENREARQLEWNKFMLSEENKMKLETMKMEADGIKDAADINLEEKKFELEADQAMAKVVTENNKLLRG